MREIVSSLTSNWVDAPKKVESKNEPDYSNFIVHRKNRKLLKNVDVNECEGYAKYKKIKWKGEMADYNTIMGCKLFKDPQNSYNNQVWYNKGFKGRSSAEKCNAPSNVSQKYRGWWKTFYDVDFCIEKEVNKDDFILKHNGTPIGDVNKNECMQYSIINNKKFSNINNTENPFGCFLHTGTNPSDVFFNSNNTSTMACDSTKRCVIKNKYQKFLD